MDREAAEKALVQLAERSAATWLRVRGEAFVGDTTIETANTVYRFKDGVFSGRAPRPLSNQEQLAWESPPTMAGVELIGFMADEGGLWSLSPRWRSGALAVITTKVKAFTLTSPTLSCTIERPDPVRTIPERSDVFDVPTKRPPTVRRPAPPSMTRLQPVPPSTR
jgi:hypothetical protein